MPAPPMPLMPTWWSSTYCAYNVLYTTRSQVSGNFFSCVIWVALKNAGLFAAGNAIALPAGRVRVRRLSGTHNILGPYFDEMWRQDAGTDRALVKLISPVVQ